MKYFILLFLLFIYCFSSYAAVVPRDLKCSRAGSDVLLVNGINWGEPSVVFILAEIERGFLNNKGMLDPKGTNGSHVTFKYSYNHSSGFLRDMLESAAQKVSQNFNISTNNAFVAAYYFTYKNVVTANFIESIFNARGVTFSSISNYLISYFSPNTLDKMVQDSFNINVTDTMKLKTSISSTLLTGKKLILITESQGNFFGKQAILDFFNGESLIFGGKSGRINDYLGTIGQLQIAPPTGSLLPKNKVVLNDRDIINLVFFERPSSNFTLIPPSPDLRKVLIDRFANHFITSTYLNDENMTTGNLSALRDFTLQSIIDLASLLDSNCPKTVISYTKNKLQVNFNSTGNTDLTGLTYSWDFGDTQTSEEKAPSHIYSQAGTYLVSLTVTDTYGGSSSITENVSVEKAATGDASVKLCMTNDDTSKYDFNLYAIDATPEGDALVESFSFNYTQSLNSDGYRINKCLCKTVNLQSNLEYGLSIKGISQELGDKIYPYAEYLVPENSTINFAVTYFVYPYRGYTHYIRDDSGWMCNE